MFVCVQAVSEEAYTAVVCQHVQEHLSRHSKRVFDSPVLPAAQAYVAAVPLEFLRLLLGQVLSTCSHSQASDASSILLFVAQHLQQCLFCAFGALF